MLNNFNSEAFLSKHWQKSPCLIKNALSQVPDFISAEELAGLALDEEVESRIVSSIDNQWQVQQGPFEESIFSNLGESQWTLLVQTLDFWLPEINQLLQDFNFIPRWRFDDVMVSYATDGGGVGPHYDNYDVFLIQTQGQRRWRVGTKDNLPPTNPLIEGLKHLQEFEPVIDVVMQPGDILYVPPETAHWGQSIGESMGYSIGYRAPQQRDLLALLAEHFESSHADQSHSFFDDSYRSRNNPANLLEPELIDWAKHQLALLAKDESLLVDLLGRSLSRSKIDCVPLEPTDCQSLSAYKSIKILPGLNTNYFVSSDKVQVFIEGDCYPFELASEPAISALLSGQQLTISELKQMLTKVDFSLTLTNLINIGYFLINM
jgi:50S ribosomal protein L16 3-hydroxylase